MVSLYLSYVDIVRISNQIEEKLNNQLAVRTRIVLRLASTTSRRSSTCIWSLIQYDY